MDSAFGLLFIGFFLLAGAGFVFLSMRISWKAMQLNARGVRVETTPLRTSKGAPSRRIGSVRSYEGDKLRAYFVTLTWQDLHGFTRRREFHVTRHSYNDPEGLTLLLDPEDRDFAQFHVWHETLPRFASRRLVPLFGPVSILIILIMGSSMVAVAVALFIINFT